MYDKLPAEIEHAEKSKDQLLITGKNCSEQFFPVYYTFITTTQ